VLFRSRFGTPDELIGATILLASDAGQFITGSELVVDGGFNAMTICVGLVILGLGFGAMLRISPIDHEP